MRTPVDQRLREESARFSLRFACEDCAHVSHTRGLDCSLGYPAAPRRNALREPILEFCKTFELGR